MICQVCGQEFKRDLPEAFVAFMARVGDEHQTCADCWRAKLERIQEQPHPEIPSGHYCYSIISAELGKVKTQICQHWEGTEFGARCRLLQLDSLEYDPFNLIWDQCKECGINMEDDDDAEESGNA